MNATWDDVPNVVKKTISEEDRKKITGVSFNEEGTRFTIHFGKYSRRIWRWSNISYSWVLDFEKK